ncbi:ECF transporter S component [Anaerosinus sp.]|uniref:ECF transporter S component n=1 Tax=Selenobaculum sp. TaxID=3074374 RepID=UPI003AB3351A
MGFEKNRVLKVNDIVKIGMLAAMCAIMTSIKVPFGADAMVHLGTACVFLIGILFGGIYAGFAAAIGSGFFDLLMGFSPYTLWSFFIKGIAGFLIGTIAHGLWPQKTFDGWLKKALLGMVIAAIWTLGGYILAWWYVTGSLTIAISYIPSSIMTSTAGFIVAVVVAPVLRKKI